MYPKAWMSPPGRCICEKPECVLGPDKLVAFDLRERCDRDVFWQIIRVDSTGFAYETGQAGFGGDVHRYRGSFEMAKTDIEECMKDGLSFTALPEWQPFCFPIRQVEVKFQ